MKRRDFLRRGLASGATVATLGAAAACTAKTEGESAAVHTRPRVRWRLASSFPRSLDTIFGAAENLSRRVASLTDDRFRIRVHQPGEIVGPLQVLDSVQRGTTEMGHSASYYFIGKSPALAFDCSVPFGLDARQHMAWLASAGGLEVLREVFADFGIVNLPGGNTGVQMGGWFREPVSSLQELKGIKMRIPGMGGKVMDRLGVSVQVLAGPDIYPALERGAIDATEWVGPYDDAKLGFHQIAKHYYYPGWWEPGPALTFYVNRVAWDALPAEYRQVLEVASAEAGVRMLTDYDAKNPRALATLLEQGVQLHRFSEDIMNAAHEASASLLAEQCAADSVFRKVHDHWDEFRRVSSRWFATAEFAYQSFVHGHD